MDYSYIKNFEVNLEIQVHSYINSLESILKTAFGDNARLRGLFRRILSHRDVPDLKEFGINESLIEHSNASFQAQNVVELKKEDEKKDNVTALEVYNRFQILIDNVIKNYQKRYDALNSTFKNLPKSSFPYQFNSFGLFLKANTKSDSLVKWYVLDTCWHEVEPRYKLRELKNKPELLKFLQQAIKK